ncbi:uncharacterized protein LODBEIA_P32600 [Lodderomyces beijingensis]|uniref:Putative tRNA (cytidine(32)/guanosine(34)-2'-O)-methyltransferase n=1 Tax=Lodderomyces beijingensis TaxID=1775926 RepID=A0ABP0ZPI5_9ASCO
MGRTNKDKRDLYYRKAKEDGWRARSAYKLLQLDQQFHLLSDISRVVDLCAAPGSWSQVLSSKLASRNNSKIIAVDLQPMTPIAGVTTLQADITHPQTLQQIRDHFEGELADFVCSDGAPDVTGMNDLDEYVQHQLVYAALQLTCCILKPGGSFVAKIFRGRDIDVMYAMMSRFFDRVVCAKPRSSRSTSLEAFIVCLGYRPIEGLTPRLDLNLSTDEFFARAGIRGGGVFGGADEVWEEDDGCERCMVEFVACGDLDDVDSDATYRLDDNAVRLEPVQRPTAPPYKLALDKKRKGELAKR